MIPALENPDTVTIEPLLLSSKVCIAKVDIFTIINFFLLGKGEIYATVWLVWSHCGLTSSRLQLGLRRVEVCRKQDEESRQLLGVGG